MPACCRPIVGGLITWCLGVSVFFTTGRLGVFSLGYQDVTDSMRNGIGWKVALLLLVAKLLASMASYAWGGCGGVFAPTLFMGAMVGFVVGGLANVVAGLVGVERVFCDCGDLVLLASVGMSACFGAVVRAPLTALLMIFEMTHQFAIVPALMIGTVVSQAAARIWGGKHNFYDEVLLLEGHQTAEFKPSL